MYAKEEWTLRFAMEAMSNLLQVNETVHWDAKTIADSAFNMAEAMVKEAQKREVL